MASALGGPPSVKEAIRTNKFIFHYKLPEEVVAVEWTRGWLDHVRLAKSGEDRVWIVKLRRLSSGKHLINLSPLEGERGVGVTCTIHYITLGTEESLHPAVVKALSDRRSSRRKILNDQASRRKVLQCNWNWTRCGKFNPGQRHGRGPVSA